MLSFYIDWPNFVATAKHLLENGAFNSPPTQDGVEELLRGRLKGIYTPSTTHEDIDECAKVWQSVFCMATLDSSLGADTYQLQLTTRLSTPSALDVRPL